MEKRFKKGDRVLCTDNGKYGNITFVDKPDDYGEMWYEVTFDDGEENWIMESDLELTDVDKKTAFLTELKELLSVYNAEIVAHLSDFEEVSLAFNIGDDTVEYGYGKQDDEVKITPSNIFDYDK